MKSDWVSASFRKLGRAVVTLSSVGASRVDDDIWKDATVDFWCPRRRASDVYEDVKEHEILQYVSWPDAAHSMRLLRRDSMH